MRTRFTTVEKLSTGRHFLAFRADPPSSCLLSSTSALILQLLAQAQDENQARQQFMTLCKEKFPEPARTFEEQASALLKMGLIEK